MSTFGPFGSDPYEQYKRDLARAREERLKRQRMFTPPGQGRWRGKYPTHVDELPDSIADLPDWTDDDIRQLDNKIYYELFGSAHPSLAPAMIQLEKKERGYPPAAPVASPVQHPIPPQYQTSQSSTEEGNGEPKYKCYVENDDACKSVSIDAIVAHRDMKIAEDKRLQLEEAKERLLARKENLISELKRI